MKENKDVLKDVEELSPEALKKAVGGTGEPVLTDTKDISDEVKDNV